jgi:DNA repair protein RadC
MQTNSKLSNLAEIQISYSTNIKYKDRPKITSADQAIKLFRSIWSKDMELREECYLLLLNRANRVLGWYRASIGGVTGTVIDPRLVFSVALKCNACGAIIAHNHPSGNTEPSHADVAITKQLKDGGRLLEISILDHLILTKESFYSFAEEGHM